MPDAQARRALIRAALAALAGLAAGCRFNPDVAAGRLPRSDPLPRPPSLALVLGSGGPRGFAHIGVLKVLEDEGIRPDLLVGASVGAMVGALFAAGKSARELERMAYDINLAEFFEVGMIGIGKASGVATQNYVNKHVGGKAIEELGIPFAAAATRVRDGKLVLFTRGDTGLAVRASSANPTSFEPVRVGEDEYIDGDEVSPLPVRGARALGAGRVLAVDVSAYPEDTPPGVPREWIEGDARRLRQIALEAPHADAYMHPNIGYYAGHNDAYRRRVIAIAEDYTRSALPQIRARLARPA